ncbi:GntR family transcriptional regulator [Aureimonas sp. AU12]|uniref:GntR family transcriptional regulator n=1 Tax=Aureimonas sp. AU12 TaxID=1638161 RepID=UPI0009EB9A49|nr:GntR family transcriptional regulator [Aureimonas sp. AU12]
MLPVDPQAPPPDPSSPRATWETIHARLHEAIVRHRLDPGAKLVEDEIAAHFGVSRTIVRAALQALAREGVVEIRRHRGASVARPSPEEARGIFEARGLVEPHLVRMAAARIKPDDVSGLRACLEREHAAVEADRPQEAVHLSAEFHRVIAGIAGHGVLERILADLLSRSSLVVALYWRRPETLCESHAHHALVDALERRDGGRAAALMERHLVELLAGLDLGAEPARRTSLANALSMRAPTAS